MATLKLELNTTKVLKKEHDRHPIYVRVVKDGKTCRKQVGVAFAHEWDPRNQIIKAKGRKDHVADTILLKKSLPGIKLSLGNWNDLAKSGPPKMFLRFKQKICTALLHSINMQRHIYPYSNLTAGLMMVPKQDLKRLSGTQKKTSRSPTLTKPG
jgi:hypothetical protein